MIIDARLMNINGGLMMASGRVKAVKVHGKPIN